MAPREWRYRISEIHAFTASLHPGAERRRLSAPWHTASNLLGRAAAARFQSRGVAVSAAQADIAAGRGLLAAVRRSAFMRLEQLAMHKQ
jgi:hypothetical protein